MWGGTNHLHGAWSSSTWICSGKKSKLKSQEIWQNQEKKLNGAPTKSPQTENKIPENRASVLRRGKNRNIRFQHRSLMKNWALVFWTYFWVECLAISSTPGKIFDFIKNTFWTTLPLWQSVDPPPDVMGRMCGLLWSLNPSILDSHKVACVSFLPGKRSWNTYVKVVLFATLPQMVSSNFARHQLTGEARS